METVLCPNDYMIQEMCKKTVRVDPYSLKYCPWLVCDARAKKMWHKDIDSDHNDDDELITWCSGYEQRKD